jgi:hypothetical protein
LLFSDEDVNTRRSLSKKAGVNAAFLGSEKFSISVREMLDGCMDDLGRS